MFKKGFHEFTHTLYTVSLKLPHVILVYTGGLWCLMSLSAIYHLYRGGQFY